MSADDPRIAFFDRLAPDWDGQHSSIEETVARLEDLRPMLGLQPGQQVLEVGCGTGQLTGWLIERVGPGHVVSIDFAPEMIAHARRSGLSADFRCADVCADDLGEAQFDVVWCKHSFPHFRDQLGALRNLARALKPGGRLLVVHTLSWQALNALHENMEGPVAGDFLPSPARWRELLRDAALELVELIERKDLFFLQARRPVS